MSEKMNFKMQKKTISKRPIKLKMNMKNYANKKTQNLKKYKVVLESLK